MMKVLYLIPFYLLLSGCAAMIMSIGEAETNVVNGSSTYSSISNLLGSYPEIKEIQESLKVRELRKLYPSIEVLRVPTENADGEILYDYSNKQAVKFTSFNYTGRIERRTAVGETIALSGYTLFIAELFTIPYAISHQLSAGHSKHTVDVWFDEKEHVIGYVWTEEKREGI